MKNEFWRNRRVFITGHTGFKGGWLSLWLSQLGAEVTGFALPPPSEPSLYAAAHVDRDVHSLRGDVRDAVTLASALAGSRPDIVFHCAAQSLVRASYQSPVDTYGTNVMGTVHLLDAIRSVGGVRAAVVVTSDKCYENRESEEPYRECDRLGGRDPYSSSKACAELVTASYRTSFFDTTATAVATARAGNVIGGGDWAADRLVPDVIRAWTVGRPAVIRHPHSVRPWQHVLEPLHGYLLLAEALASSGQAQDSWNFGPGDQDTKPVSDVVDAFASRWGHGARWSVATGTHVHESAALRLDSSRARTQLAWSPRMTLDSAIDWSVEWYKAHLETPDRARQVTIEQIERYQALLA